MNDNVQGRRPLILGFLALCLLGFVVLWMTSSQKRAHADIERSLRTQQHLSSLLAQMQDVETGGRGFLLTGQSSFLQPHLDSRSGIERDLAAIETSLKHDPAALAAIGRIRTLSEERTALLATILAARADGRTIQTDALRHVQSITAEMRAIVVDQTDRQESRLQRRFTSLGWQSSGIYFSLFLIDVLTICLFLLVHRHMQQRLQQAIAMGDALKAANDEIRIEAQRREHVETQLFHLQKMEAIGRLSRVIAHDFKNMIAGIVMAVGNIRMHADPDDATMNEDIELALQGTSKAAELASQLLIFSKQETLDPQIVDINALITDVAGLLHRTIGRYLAIEMTLGDDIGMVLADPEHVQTTIINLCLNARDAMPNGGRITIATRNITLFEGEAPRYPDAAPGEYVAMLISDTGAGMTPEVAARAFDPYYSTKNDAKGVGLSQVYGFVSQSGGHIRMFSVAGHGTTMKIILPRVYAEPGEVILI